MLQLSEKDATRTKNKVHLREMKKMPQEQKKEKMKSAVENLPNSVLSTYMKQKSQDQVQLHVLPQKIPRQIQSTITFAAISVNILKRSSTSAEIPGSSKSSSKARCEHGVLHVRV